MSRRACRGLTERLRNALIGTPAGLQEAANASALAQERSADANGAKSSVAK